MLLRAAPGLSEGRALLDALPVALALLLLAAGALWLAATRARDPRPVHAAFGLTSAAAALAALVLAVMLWPDAEACERLMRPPTPAPPS